VSANFAKRLNCGAFIAAFRWQTILTPIRKAVGTQRTLPTATLLCHIAPSSRRANRKSASYEVAGTTPHKIIPPGKDFPHLTEKKVG
jgi:hypothetical protein